MKTATKALLAISSLAVSSVMANEQFAGYIENMDSPIGSISVASPIVQLDPNEDFESSESRNKRIPSISWNIQYPQLLYIPGQGALQDSLMTIKLLGVQFSSGSVSAWYRVNNGSWQRIATYESVSYNDASQRPELASDVFIPQGATLDFAVRSNAFNRTFIMSRDPNNIQLVRSGGVLPTIGGYEGQIPVNQLLSSYLDGDNVDVGSVQNFLLLSEAYSRDPGSSTFDLQDMLMAVEFREVPQQQ